MKRILLFLACIIAGAFGGNIATLIAQIRPVSLPEVVFPPGNERNPGLHVYGDERTGFFSDGTGNLHVTKNGAIVNTLSVPIGPNVSSGGRVDFPAFELGLTESQTLDVIGSANTIRAHTFFWPVDMTPTTVEFRATEATSSNFGVGIYSADGSTLYARGVATIAGAASTRILTFSETSRVPAGMVLVAYTSNANTVDLLGLNFTLEPVGSLYVSGNPPFFSNANESSSGGVLPETISLGSPYSPGGLPFFAFYGS